jgi:hypothetical protein
MGNNNRQGPGVLGQSTQGTGVVGIGGTFAAEFVGRVRVQGDIAVSGDVILATAALADEEDNAVAEISLAQKLADIDERTQKIENMLKGLVRMTARLPDGRTLVNVVGTIEAKVNQL